MNNAPFHELGVRPTKIRIAANGATAFTSNLSETDKTRQMLCFYTPVPGNKTGTVRCLDTYEANRVPVFDYMGKTNQLLTFGLHCHEWKALCHVALDEEVAVSHAASINAADIGVDTHGRVQEVQCPTESDLFLRFKYTAIVAKIDESASIRPVSILQDNVLKLPPGAEILQMSPCMDNPSALFCMAVGTRHPDVDLSTHTADFTRVAQLRIYDLRCQRQNILTKKLSESGTDTSIAPVHGKSAFYIGSADGSLSIYDVRTGNGKRAVSGFKHISHCKPAAGCAVLQLATVPGRDYVAVGLARAGVLVYSPSTCRTARLQWTKMGAGFMQMCVTDTGRVTLALPVHDSEFLVYHGHENTFKR